MNRTYNLPILYHRAKSGKISEWEIFAEVLNSFPHVTTVYGYVDGVKQRTSVRVDSGKNLGKSNETTAWEQACLNAKSKWEKQKLGNYRETLEEEIKLLPMLAHRYQDHKAKITYPCFVQPKLNGVRVLAKITDEGVEYWSRKGKTYETLTHWNDQLKSIFPVGTILDGEAYHHDLTFQEIVKRVKRVKTCRENIKENPLQYWIYDVVQLNKPFKQRYDFIEWYFNSHSINSKTDFSKIVKCQTTLIKSEKELYTTHRIFTKEGFEGTIIRNVNGLYKPNYRSYDLLKYKDFIDEEFKIVGGFSAQGRDEGTVVFQCKTSTGFIFNVRPKGTFEQRKEFYDNLEQYLGRMLTVRYQEKSEDGIPIFPVGLSVRDYE